MGGFMCRLEQFLTVVGPEHKHEGWTPKGYRTLERATSAFGAVVADENLPHTEQSLGRSRPAWYPRAISACLIIQADQASTVSAACLSTRTLSPDRGRRPPWRVRRAP